MNHTSDFLKYLHFANQTTDYLSHYRLINYLQLSVSLCMFKFNFYSNKCISYLFYILFNKYCDITIMEVQVLNNQLLKKKLYKNKIINMYININKSK